MADPARKQYPEEIEPEIRPNLRVIEGGGNSTPDRANLKALSKSEANPEGPGADGSVLKQESDPSSNVIQGPWKNETTPQPLKIKSVGRLSLAKKWIALGGIGIGILGIILLVFILLFPLKLEMFIKNITAAASSVPEYAVGQRMEYLVTKALAVRLLMTTNSAIDGKLIFCSGGAVGCSLFATYTNEYFEKKLGITLVAEPNGRARLGGIAQSWDISVGQEDGKNLEGPRQRIQSNSEMRRLIRDEVRVKGKDFSIITRFLARKLLMKKFGVVLWRGPPQLEAAQNKIINARANIKASITKATIGKITPRLAIYLTCLQNSAECSSLRSKLSGALKEVKEPDPNSDNYDKEKRDYDKYKASKAIIDGTTLTESEAAGPIKKIITKKVLAVAGGAGVAIGVVDLLMSAIGSIDDGAIEKIWYDMSTQVYTGFSTELQVINDKLKLGELDSNTIGAAFELVSGAESSPLYQAETGLNVDTSQGITTDCNGVDGEKVPTKLSPGEVVCPDQKAVRDYTSSFSQTPGWQALAATAAAWNSTAGLVIDTAGDAIGAILTAIPGFNQLMELAGGAVKPAIDWLMGLFFEPPATGPEASGSDNYTALSAGIRVEQNALSEEGVDDDGTAMGSGGGRITNEQVGMIDQIQRGQEQTDFDNQSAIAKIFDTSSRFSFINQFAVRLPSSLSGLASLPLSSLSSILKGSSASAANTAALNPFGLPMYGYAPGDPALTADPGTYTEAFCEQSAKDRKDSFYSEPGEIETYHKSDPCALEKMVVGAALNNEGVTDDTYSLKYPQPEEETEATGNVVLPVNPGYKAFYDDSDFGTRSCAGCSSWHKGLDFQMGLGNPVYAAGDGVVTAAGGSNPGCNRGLQFGNNTVSIKLSNGVVLNYLHMRMSDITVKVGDKVTAGQTIGKVGQCGQAQGPHLHFEVMLGTTTDEAVKALFKDPSGRWVDPKAWLALYGVKA